jgi:glycosyltransferase involved in cell wall biosynthesis
MNINFVLRFHDNTPSGGRKIVYEYANYLIRNGHKVKITFVADTPFIDRKWNKEASIKHYLEYLKKNKKQKSISWMKLDEAIKIDSLFSIKQLSFDNSEIIIAFDYGIALSLSEKLPNLKKCFYLIQHDEKVYYDKRVIRKAWKLSMTKIVISTWLYKLLKKYCDDVVLVKNYVDIHSFYVSQPIENRSNVVSLIQHPNPSKGTAIGINALKIVKEKIPDLKVIMFGTHEKKNNLPDYFIYYRMANVVTLREKIYNLSSIYLLPSFVEGWGLTATEAMACGATLVSTRNGGVDDFGIDNETALLSDPGNVVELANNIIELLTDTKKRIALGYAGKNEVDQLTFEKSAKLFEAVLRKKDIDSTSL